MEMQSKEVDWNRPVVPFDDEFSDLAVLVKECEK
jgi:hypothetical protein